MKNERQHRFKHKTGLNTIVLFLFLNLLSCSNTDLPVCINPIDVLIRINVQTPKDEDITTEGFVKTINLYVFDSNKQYIEEIIIPGDSIISLTSISLNSNNINDGFWIIGWGNLNNSATKALTKSISFSDAITQINRNTEGYAIEPNDLFFGIKNITSASLADTTKNYINLSLKRKTAQISIAVKGLDPQYEDYYFIISGSNNDSYTLEGNLTGNPIEYKNYGVFDSTKTFFTSSNPFKMFSIEEGLYNTISIYRGDTLITSTHINDNTGKNIVPIIGVRNNIFIDLTKGSESPGVEIIVTDWNTVYHWLDW